MFFWHIEMNHFTESEAWNKKKAAVKGNWRCIAMLSISRYAMIRDELLRKIRIIKRCML